MKRRWFIYLIIGIIMITGGCLGYLQFGRDMDVYGSYAMTADNYHEERLIVVLNKLYVADQKACAEKIVKWQAEKGKQMFAFSYLPEDSDGTYSTIDNPEEFILEIEE